MKPIPQTVQVATELGRYEFGFDLLAHLQDVADKVQAVVPDCIGLSIAWVDRGVCFTLVATDEEIAVLDAVQYLTGGPCVEGVELGTGLQWSNTDPLDEAQWQGFTQATAARAVKCTLTLPLVAHGEVVGSANMYAASDNSFEGHADVLADILGGSAADMVCNADLSFSTRTDAEDAPAALRHHDEFNIAVGLLTSALGVDPAQATERLLDAAARARLTPQQLATGLMALFD